MQKKLNSRILQQFRPDDCERVSQLGQIISLKQKHRENLSREILEDVIELPYSRNFGLPESSLLVVIGIVISTLSFAELKDPAPGFLIGILLCILGTFLWSKQNRNMNHHIAYYHENYYERAFELAQNYRAYWEAWKKDGCTAQTIRANGMEVVLAQNIFDNIEKKLS
jgi:ABC-type transport system involved in cytochrome bd biosynthesis fused ATPase/permease subunit